MSLTYGSVCSGIESASIAWEPLGMRPAWFAEVEPFPSAIECERLQGFPDNHTRIPWKGKSPENCPDGPRYKAIGNSKAVPVIKFVGERILRELQK